MRVAAARHAVNRAALARDRVALVALGASLPATQAFAYERHRARAYAHALEASGDAALAELNLAAASMPPSAVVLAADASALHLLLGDPARSITGLAAAAQGDVRLDDFGRDVLLAATREAPSEWRRSARAAVLVGHPRAATAAASAAFDSLGDRRAYRGAIATAGLLAALVALLALPARLVDGGAPGDGVTAPSFAAPPSIVVVPDRAARTPRPPEAAGPASQLVQPSATLVRATPQAAPRPVQRPQPGRPRVARPGPVAPAPAPAPTPTPAPAPEPAPPAALAVAPPAVATPAPATPSRLPKNAKGKAKGHAKQAAKAAARAVAAAATAAAPQPAAPGPETQPAAPSEPPGQAKHDGKGKDKQDKKDKQK